MLLSEWKAISDQFLEQAEQTMPAWQVQSMRITQEIIMRNHLDSGFLTLEPQTPLERTMASDPFKNIDFSVSVDPKNQPFPSADRHTDPWMKVDLADTFNRHIEAMVPFYDRATLEMIRDADVLKDMWPDLTPLYGR